MEGILEHTDLEDIVLEHIPVHTDLAMQHTLDSPPTPDASNLRTKEPRYKFGSVRRRLNLASLVDFAENSMHPAGWNRLMSVWCRPPGPWTELSCHPRNSQAVLNIARSYDLDPIQVAPVLSFGNIVVAVEPILDTRGLRVVDEGFVNLNHRSWGPAAGLEA